MKTPESGVKTLETPYFDKLYDTYYMRVYSFVMTIVKSAHIAEEVTQQTFYKALNALNKPARFDGRSDEFTWLCAIAKNAAMDELKRQSRLMPPDEEIPSAKSVEQTAEDGILTLRLHQLLHEMEEPYKEVFSLRVFGELSFAKIGLIFGKTENWARVTYHRAKLKLQERLDNDGK